MAEGRRKRAGGGQAGEGLDRNGGGEAGGGGGGQVCINMSSDDSDHRLREY